MRLFSSTVIGPAVNATVGPTLFTVTRRSAVLLAAPSLSVTAAVTVDDAGPSGKTHLKLPEVLVLLSLPVTFVPAAPQLVLAL